jgi:dTDP-4-dehydrorhamnose reductase
VKNVIVIGGSGMLGSMLVDVLSRNAAVKVAASFSRVWIHKPNPGIKWFMYRMGGSGRPVPLSVELTAGDWVVNAAGLIRHRMGPSPSMMMRSEAIRVNSLLPHELAQICLQTGARLINVTTDCVFSGEKGGYREDDPHDPEDFYGQTKSMGEPRGCDSVVNLRCSIVGPEARGKLSLLEWFLSQEEGSTVQGWANHAWNGVTTLALARVIEGMVLYGGDLALPDVHHLVPGDDVSKAQLLELFKAAYGRRIEIEHVGQAQGVDRTLGTSQPELNNRLWSLAGFEKPPRIEEMVQKLANHKYRFAKVSEVTS